MPALSLERVCEAALELADSDGLGALSMRKLGQRLGVAPMTIYGYVESRDALLEVMCDQVLDLIEIPLELSDDWQEAIVQIMDAMRTLLVKHPSVVQIVSTRRNKTHSVGFVRMVDHVLRLLEIGGLPPESTVRAFGFIHSFTLGYAAYQVPRMHADLEENRMVADGLREVAVRRGFSRVEAGAEQLSRVADVDYFRRGLAALVSGLSLAVFED